MPTVTLNKKVFEELVGRKLPLEELKDRISMLGTDLERIEGDEIEVEIFPNRPDMLSEQGFARAFSSFIGVKKGLRKYTTTKFGSSLTIQDVPKTWPYAVACVVKGLRFDDEKIREVIQLQEKLGTTLTRNRKKGGIGLYPLDKITFPIMFVGKKPENIKFRPLGFPTELTAHQILAQHPKGREYGHIMESWDTFPVFVDAKGVIMSMPPIINSHDVGKIDETTTNVFIEGTGPDLNTIMTSLYILTTSLADMGGTIHSLEMVYPDKKINFPDFTLRKMKLDLQYINTRLGLDLQEKNAIELLERMGFGYDTGNVLIPKYRNDILHQVDLAEDIAIAYGYENFEEEIPNVATIGEEHHLKKFARKVREILAGLKMIEVKNYHLITAEDLNRKMNLDNPLISLQNALGEHNHLRNAILPSLIKNIRENQHNEFPQNIFEVGRVFTHDTNTETKIGENEHLSVVLCHDKTDFTEIKQVLDTVLSSLGICYTIQETQHASFIPGRVGEIIIHDKSIGIIGELSPEVITLWNIQVPIVAFEVDVEMLFKTIKF
ncbi:phenylalanine--tRNA ligase subunit beta [Candidatus Woesearchaeota archaeon CG10_big_fil_rev_8_21_14_0_10_36_11]|nr:MAG: phenylalanine--tRNA ligase subunit beta [Candidatus Woesearchaeota archaeon CG10_big_fil_rev_8_21_14_0_10_36_11]